MESTAAVVAAHGLRRDFFNDCGAIEEWADAINLVDPIHAVSDHTGAEVKHEGAFTNQLGQAIISALRVVASKVPTGQEQRQAMNRKKWMLAHTGFVLPHGAPSKLHKIFDCVREDKLMKLPDEIQSLIFYEDTVDAITRMQMKNWTIHCAQKVLNWLGCELEFDQAFADRVASHKPVE